MSKQIPLGKSNLFAIVDEEDFERVSEFIWALAICKGRPYVHRQWREQGRKKTEKLHHFILGKPINGMVVDHVNNEGLDNRKINLRFATI